MSVRRLAEETVQPDGFRFSRAMAGEAEGWIRKYPEGRQQSAVIPLLMLAQEQEGWVTKASIEHIADMLDMPLIRVLEVATFYTQFQLRPVGIKAHVQICGTTPCMLRGSEELIALCRKKIHPEPFHTNDAGTLSWEEVECQGACVNAPMVMIFKDTYEDLTPERLDEIIDAFEADRGETISPGPQIDRIYSAPEGGLTSLLDVPATKATSRKKTADRTGDGGKQKMKKVAKPETYAPEGDDAFADPDQAKVPGKRKPGKKKAVTAKDDETSSTNVADPGTTTDKSLNPTMRVASTAHEADEVTHPKPVKKAGTDPLANRLSNTDDSDDTPTTRAAKPASGKKKKAVIGADTGTTLESARSASNVAPKAKRVKQSVSGGNATMRVAATASGRAKRHKKDGSPASGSGRSDTRPQKMEKPATLDDLKMIAGIGPKIEGILHELGIWTWAQIAAWSEAEADWVNEHLRFKGRIERENWIAQADALATGGRDEYVKRFGKEPR